MSRKGFFLFSIKLFEEGLHYHLFTGSVIKTSHREEGLYYHPITAPVVITLDEEEWMHCHHIKGQFVNYTSTL
jgi:hypothetical protein